jgi:hypothetical protein
MITKVRALDSNGDWTFGLGRGNYLSGVAAIEQQIRCRILQFYRECFFDMGAGIDWFRLLGGADEMMITLAVSGVILRTEGVTGIHSLEVNLTTGRAFTGSYSVTTIYSTLTSSFNFSI